MQRKFLDPNVVFIYEMINFLVETYRILKILIKKNIRPWCQLANRRHSSIFSWRQFTALNWPDSDPDFALTDPDLTLTLLNSHQLESGQFNISKSEILTFFYKWISVSKLSFFKIKIMEDKEFLDIGRMLVNNSFRIIRDVGTVTVIWHWLHYRQIAMTNKSDNFWHAKF